MTTTLISKYRSIMGEEWAYIAGLVDGEGCIFMRADPARCEFSISQKRPAVLQWIADILGGSVKDRRSTKGVYIWVMYERGTIAQVLSLLSPYLRVKHAEATAFLTWNRRRSPPKHGRRLLPEDESLDKQLELTLKKLKKSGTEPLVECINSGA